MMRHDPKFLTFHDAYLNQMTESELYKLFPHVSLTLDPRAKRDMVPAEVWANLPPDPEIVELEERRAFLKQGRHRTQGLEAEEEIRMLTEQITLKKGRRVHLVTREYRQYYFYHRPTWDIERQARGEDEDEYMEPVIHVTIPERKELAEIVCHQPEDLTEDQIFQRRIHFIDLMAALCRKRETVKRSRNTKRRPALIDSLCSFTLPIHAAQCPDCIGDERLSREERTFTYCRPTVMNDHFDDQHLVRREQAERSGEKICCEHPKCRDLKFQHLNHFRHHVQEVHGVMLRTSEQVKQRRQRKVRRRQMARGKRPQ
ncbi:FluG domain-containing protein [Fusarium solani]|uniref:FluG domain-containing protein n=1 Tax=Fusarium solani TaxID=169388 RepID=A0A9P9HY57_FUSSL|nr:FluG domain-containing protein [Fusarium solani]KAH7265750.1 FluG domain-containing protein [Fusarium solani]